MTNLTACGGHGGSHFRQSCSEKHVDDRHPNKPVQDGDGTTLRKPDGDGAAYAHPAVQDCVHERDQFGSREGPRSVRTLNPKPDECQGRDVALESGLLSGSWCE